MKLDFESMQAAAAEKAKASERAFHDAMNGLYEKDRAQKAAFMQGLDKAAEANENKLREQMEREIKAAQEQAAEEIRGKYAARYGSRDWNASDSPCARDMAAFSAKLGQALRQEVEE